MTNIEIALHPNSIDKVCKQTKAIPSELEGYFLYDSDLVCINLNCDTFIDATERVIITQFSRVVTHEILHKLIYEQTNAVSDEFEEILVDKLSKMRYKW